MALDTIKTSVTYSLNNTQVEFAIPFEYLARKFVVVTLIRVNGDRTVLSQASDYRFATKTMLSLNQTWGPANGYSSIEIRRFTSASERLVEYRDGSILRAVDLEVSQIQSIHIAEEAREAALDSIAINSDGNLDALGRRIVNVADPIDNQDAATKAWALNTFTPSSSAEGLRRALSEPEGWGLIGTSSGRNLKEVIQLSPYDKLGDLGSGVILQSATDVVAFGGFYWKWNGTFPKASTESTTTGYKAVGLLNGWPINHTRNWNIKSDGSNQTSAVEFMVDNLPADSTVISDFQPIYVNDVKLTTVRPSVRFKGVKFAPWFPSDTTRIDRMFDCTRSGLIFEDVTIQKPPAGYSAGSVFRMTDCLNCRFNRITCTGTSGLFSKFYELYNVKESSWSHSRIDMDPATNTGIVFDFNYCVNNTVNGGYYGHGENFMNFSNTGHPTFQYHNEGIYVTNISNTFFNLPFRGVWVTALFVDNFQFDFCGTRFFEFTNGGHSGFSNGWFATGTDSTSTLWCVMAGGTYSGLTMSNVKFINNVGNNSISLNSLNPHPDYGVIYSNCSAQGFSAGIVLGTRSMMYGLNFTNEGTTVGTNNSQFEVRGQGMNILNKNAWAAGANTAYVSFSNTFGSARIRAYNGSLSNRIGMSFSILTGGVETEVLSLSDLTIRLPQLPTTAAAAAPNGLYAGTDGIVRISRTITTPTT